MADIVTPERIAARAGSQKYDIIIGKPLSQLPDALSRVAARGARVGVICDAAISHKYGAALVRGLQGAGFQVDKVDVPAGEHSKSLSQAARLYRFCARRNLDRQSWLIALGGGVVGDLTGFVAATYLRGVALVQVPTTLLAQVDSSIGGKTGVDIPQGKNLVGAFYQPRLVWIDPTLLKSLPKAHWRNGLAEVIKYAAIQDKALFETLEEDVESLLKGFSTPWVRIIVRCAAIKARVVQEDPLETRGFRAMLNFGHSVGHAIEAATGYKGYLHGEAVAIGMFVASFISQQTGLLDPVERIRLGTLLTRAGLPISVRKAIPREQTMEFLARDKKAQDGSVRFVLLQALGRAVSGQMVQPQVLDMALSASGL